MFPCDPISTRQMLDAELIVARQRSRGKVVSDRPGRWRAALERLSTPRHAGPLPAGHELFTGLSRKQLSEAARFFTVVEVPAGRTLGKQGSPVDRFATILEGQVGVTIDGVPHAVLDDGSQINSLPLLDDEHPTHRASFDVMVPSRIAVVEAARFSAMLRRFPIIADRIHAIADVRRAYLAGLAAATDSQATSSPWIEVEKYPAHLTEDIVAQRLSRHSSGR